MTGLANQYMSNGQRVETTSLTMYSQKCVINNDRNINKTQLQQTPHAVTITINDYNIIKLNEQQQSSIEQTKNAKGVKCIVLTKFTK